MSALYDFVVDRQWRAFMHQLDKSLSPTIVLLLVVAVYSLDALYWLSNTNIIDAFAAVSPLSLEERHLAHVASIIKLVAMFTLSILLLINRKRTAKLVRLCIFATFAVMHTLGHATHHIQQSRGGLIPDALYTLVIAAYFILLLTLCNTVKNGVPTFATKTTMLPSTPLELACFVHVISLIYCFLNISTSQLEVRGAWWIKTAVDRSAMFFECGAWASDAVMINLVLSHFVYNYGSSTDQKAFLVIGLARTLLFEASWCRESLLGDVVLLEALIFHAVVIILSVYALTKSDKVSAPRGSTTDAGELADATLHSKRLKMVSQASNGLAASTKVKSN